jgi:hypothetical protein
VMMMSTRGGGAVSMAEGGSMGSVKVGRSPILSAWRSSTESLVVLGTGDNGSVGGGSMDDGRLLWRRRGGDGVLKTAGRGGEGEGDGEGKGVSKEEEEEEERDGDLERERAGVGDGAGERCDLDGR